MLVIALVYSLASLSVSFGGQDIRLEATVQHIAAVAEYALEEAQLSGTDMGLLLETVSVRGEDRVRFSWLERSREGWGSPQPAQELYEDRRLPPDIELQLSLDDIPVAEIPRADEEDGDPVPQVVFYASGETTPGAIDLRQRRSGDLLWRLEWDLLGRFAALRRGIAAEDSE
jgi:hypothetical protein